MEKAFKYYQIAASEDSYSVRIDAELQNNCYYITSLS